LRRATTVIPGGVRIERECDTVTTFRNQASDHGAVWAEFDL